jgi:hypothetical protein
MNSAQELNDALTEVATSTWKKRGAQFGQRQKLSDIDTSDTSLDLPTRFTSVTEFITSHSIIEAGGYNGRMISCSLWVNPIKKNGQPGSAIRLTAITLYK